VNRARACLFGLLAAACVPAGAATLGRAETDPESFANVDQFEVTHLELILDVNLHFREFTGSAVLAIKRLDPAATRLVLDTMDLNILEVSELSSDFMGATEKTKAIWVSRPYRLDKPDKQLGSPLVIELPASQQKTLALKIEYETQPKARGLHWLVPAQPDSKHPPFVYSDSAALAVRSWIPLQDTPSARLSYRAHIHTPDGTLAVMGAGNDPKAKHDGDYWFIMPAAVPPQQLGLAVGSLKFKPLGARTGVYAEAALLGPALKEFADTEALLGAAASLVGGAPLDRFDVVVMPTTFPQAGADHARAAFVSPTLIAGDKSLLGTFAVEIAHAEIANRESAAEPADEWIAQALAGYIGSRSMASVYGAPLAAEQALLAWRLLRAELPALDAQDQVLFSARAEQGGTPAPRAIISEKGRFFCAFLESRFGRERLDAFLEGYFDHFAGKPVSTQQFLGYLQENLLDRFPGLVTRDAVLAWILDPGLPPGGEAAPVAAFDAVDAARGAWLGARVPAAKLPTRGWSEPQWRYFVAELPPGLTATQLGELDKAFTFGRTHNAVLAGEWLRAALAGGYPPATGESEQYVMSVGRADLILPLYAEWMKTDRGTELAKRVYQRVHSGYDPEVTQAVEAVVGAPPEDKSEP